MATPYSVVDNSFLNKITDDLLLTLDEDEIQELIDMFRVAAGVKFKQCPKLKNRNDDEFTYTSDLTDEEVEIVANLMVLEWLKQRINSIEVLKQTMSTRDYTFYSQANHLDSLIALRKQTIEDVDRMIVSYTYTENHLSELGRA